VKPLLVVNPRSGGGRTGKSFDDMRGAIGAALGDIEIVMTERPGHATDLAQAGSDAGHPLVVAVGGDGTFNEVVNGVMRAAKRPEIGLIAQGTGGDFRRTLGLEHRLDKYLDALRSGRTRPLDIGRALFDVQGKPHERWFANILSAGMSGLVDRYVADSSRNLGGSFAYFGASLRALAACRPGHLRCAVTLDGETREERLLAYLIAMCNGRYFGGGMKVAPMAELDDGRLEVVAMHAPSKLGFAMGSRAIYSGAHLRNAGTVHFACQKIVIRLENADARKVFLLDVDGEPIGAPPLEIEVVPAALSLRA
jgi:YegS/Rv2252/BmrU family lipid kinase